MSLQRRKPLGRGKPLGRSAPLASVTPLTTRTPLQRGGPVNPVSGKRRAENRQRRAMAEARYPGMDPDCAVPGCPRPADDLHEILPRGRGGSITDPENTVPTCREHNEELTKSPPWGYRAGLLKHDGLCCEGRAVCSQYEEGGEAA